ncbi:MAG: pectate lyase, partial [Armatimonadetes bacterium]|nr:pectate lyase [Armatimonadota bacterium]
MGRGWRVGAVVVLLAAALASAAPREVVVAPGGSDLAPGTTAQPLATLAAAQ